MEARSRANSATMTLATDPTSVRFLAKVDAMASPSQKTGGSEKRGTQSTARRTVQLEAGQLLAGDERLGEEEVRRAQVMVDLLARRDAGTPGREEAGKLGEVRASQLPGFPGEEPPSVHRLEVEVVL